MQFQWERPAFQYGIRKRAGLRSPDLFLPAGARALADPIPVDEPHDAHMAPYHSPFWGVAAFVFVSVARQHVVSGELILRNKNQAVAEAKPGFPEILSAKLFT